MSFGSVVVMNTFLWLATTAAQSSVQRYCGLSSMTKARITVLLTIPGFVVLGLLTCFTGFVAFAYYAHIGCDPLRAGYVTDPNQLLPYFVMDIFKNTPGLPGLFVACLFSASLSSVSSSLAALSAIAWENGLKHRLGHLSSVKQASITKLLSLFFGSIAIATGFLVMQIGGTLTKVAFSIMGTTAGPMVGMYFLGATLPWAGAIGTVTGAVVGFIFTMWLAMGSALLNVHQVPLPTPLHNCTNPFAINITLDDSSLSGGGGYSADLTTTPRADPLQSAHEVTGVQRLYLISFMWYPFIATVLAYIVGALLSCIPAFRHKHPVPKKFLFPCLRGSSCCGRVTQDNSDCDFNANAGLSEKPFLGRDKTEMQPETKQSPLLTKDSGF